MEDTTDTTVLTEVSDDELDEVTGGAAPIVCGGCAC